METVDENEILDLRGLKCPLPALFARRALARLPKGFSIRVLSDDPLAPVDIPHMCHQEGYDCIKAASSGGSTALVLRRP
jgi:tRNA 2-thiouridine synthesizing protein A